MGAKRDAKKRKDERDEVGYNEEREMAYVRTLLAAYYTVGVCIDFARPKPSYYAEKFLAMRLIPAEEVTPGSYTWDRWEYLNTSDYGAAVRYIEKAERWYISDLDTGLQVAENQPVWIVINKLSRMNDERERAQKNEG